MAGRRIGHTFTKHGQNNTDELKRKARGSGVAQGQWTDDPAAEEWIADNLGELKNGTRVLPLPPGLGRLVLPDGSFEDAFWAKLVPSGTGVKTAFPVTEEEARAGLEEERKRQPPPKKLEPPKSDN